MMTAVVDGRRFPTLFCGRGIIRGSLAGMFPIRMLESSSILGSEPAMFRRSTSLEKADPEIFGAIARENQRQEDHLELIASENYASPAVMAAQGTQLTNKYAEGYPGKRYYGGCEYVDVVEQIAIDRAKKVFGCDAANVQPHSGAQANQAVFFAALQPGDTVLGMSLPHGGHLTHGSPVNISGKWFKVGAVRAPSGDRAHRLRRGRAPGARAQAQARHRRRVRVLARHRLEAVPRNRRCRRRAAHGRHGALRGAGGSGRVSLAGGHRRLHHHDHAQDAARASRRSHPHALEHEKAINSPCSPDCKAVRSCT
jgi:hypothetical protein